MGMNYFKQLSVVEQLVSHLRDAISKGELSDTMPGVRKLANTLGVSSNTVIAAVEQLEKEGFLESQGHGRRSRIVLPENFSKPGFRVTLLLYEHADISLDYTVEMQRRLKEDGYIIRVADKSLVELGMNIKRIARMVNATKTDAWVVFSSPEEILEWFTKQPIPTFALFGRFRRLPIAGIGLDKAPAFRTAIRRLVELGHQRIVLLQPKHNRIPIPAHLVRESLEELQANGIMTGSYNIPDWEPTPEGLRKRLDFLFAMSPPTALILDRPNELIATQLYLAHRGIFAPRDISLISDDDPTFEWCKPAVCCIQWKSNPWVNRVIQWVGNVANGKADLGKNFTRAKFVEKGTIGPVPTEKSPAIP
jgi:DNA-binding LacI/PurR family transcriptional regulator